MPKRARKPLNRSAIPRGKLCSLPGGQTVLEFFPAKAGVLLFYPGSLLAPGHYFVLLRAFREAGFAVAALHLPGHGLCCGHFWQTFTFPQLLAQGLKAEEYLHKAGHEHIVVCGHSQGAILALAHGAASTKLAAIAAISGVLPQMDEAIGITLFGPLRCWRERIMANLRHLSAIFPGMPVPLPAYLSLRRILHGRRSPIIVGRDYGRVSYPLKYLYSLFATCIEPVMHCPTLLLGSENDALFPPPLLRKVYETIDAPCKRLLLARDGGHTAPYNEQMAQFFARATAEFCASMDFPLNIPSLARN